MTSFALHAETRAYRVLLVAPRTEEALMLRGPAGLCLPCVHLPFYGRHAQELRIRLRNTWSLDTFVVGFLCDPNDSDTLYAIVEVITPHHSPDLIAVPLQPLIREMFRVPLQEVLMPYLTGRSPNAMVQTGWLDEALRWIESATHRPIRDKALVEQMQVGLGFCLMKVPLANGRACWFKAVGSPNAHEVEITRFLSHPHRSTSRFLPRLVAVHDEWNAMLLDDGGVPWESDLFEPAAMMDRLRTIVKAMARLQGDSVALVAPLLKLGAVSQSFDRIAADADELCDYLALAMSHQVSERVPRLTQSRLREIFDSVKESLNCLDRVAVPMCLVHGDLNAGNILWDDSCVFIDWCESYIGHPFVCLQELLFLNCVDDSAERARREHGLTQAYCEEWSVFVERAQLDLALPHMPLMAAVSALYGRGDWLQDADRNSPARFAYARTLARHMDRAVQSLTKEVA